MSTVYESEHRSTTTKVGAVEGTEIRHVITGNVTHSAVTIDGGTSVSFIASDVGPGGSVMCRVYDQQIGTQVVTNLRIEELRMLAAFLTNQADRLALGV